jgi:hypothetical protein
MGAIMSKCKQVAVTDVAEKTKVAVEKNVVKV